MKKNYKKLFGEIMRTAREKQGITQSTLAEIVGVSAAYCRDIEKGRYTPTWIIWLKICTVLNIDILHIAEKHIKPVVNEAGEFLGIKV